MTEKTEHSENKQKETREKISQASTLHTSTQMPNQTPARSRTHQVNIGGVPLGGGAPVVVQSMLNAKADDASANLRQIEELATAGCEIVRMAIPARENLKTFEEVCKKSTLPVVADVHFDTQIALASIDAGAAKLRINPGNIGGLSACDEIIKKAKCAHIPIRIGVNAGSLEHSVATRTNMSNAEKMCESAMRYINYFEARGFHDLVLSAKAHDVCETICVNKMLSEKLPHTPLHIGITEAGGNAQGIIKSAAGLGVLLHAGIGDTLRISLTDNPIREIEACNTLLSALNIRSRGVEMISCPTCGRCQINLIDIANSVEARARKLCAAHNHVPISIAVMGCVVNGPGEASSADIGIACGSGSGILFSHGEKLRRVQEANMVDELMCEIDKILNTRDTQNLDAREI